MKTPLIVRKELPMEEAVSMSAAQNWERDVIVGLVNSSEKEEKFPMYLEEARLLLEVTGENYIPDYPPYHHYVLKTD